MRMDLLKIAFQQSERKLSALRRTPRPPVIQPRPSEKLTDVNDVERWIGRLSRHIRLQREAARFGRRS